MDDSVQIWVTGVRRRHVGHFSLKVPACLPSGSFTVGHMVRIPSLLLLLTLLCGCAGKSYKVANPVVGPAPPRKIAPEAYAQAEPSPEGNIQLTSFNQSKVDPLLMTDVVARVNGNPILVGDVLEQYATKLQQAQSQMTAEQFRSTQEMLLERDLDRYVEQTLMAEAVRGKLKEEQLEAIDAQLDTFFQQQVEAMIKQANVSTMMELEGVLQEQGLSLSSMRKLFGDRQLASEYVKQRVGDPPPFTPAILKAEYTAHLAEYTTPAQVKWQQLQVSTKRPGGEAAAYQIIESAVRDLDNGAEFDDVVQKYSEGPLAKNGGHWDWMQSESIANAKVRSALDQLEVGRLSDVITSENSLQIVRVTGRREVEHTPFSEVQEGIRKRLTEEWKQARADEVIQELKAKSVVETIFDGRETTPSTTANPASPPRRPAPFAG